MSFPCTRCGACCRLIGQLPELRALDRGDGVCRHLTDENLCAIYDERPAICRVALQCPAVLTEAEWFRRNVVACEQLHRRVYGRDLERA